MHVKEETTIVKLFAGSDVFVTGGSGFMGKVLLEKLLRSCPDIGRIFVLLRPKRGKTVQERLVDIIQTPLFEPLRNKDPEVLKKLVPMTGDCAEIGLGLSAKDTATLIANVSIFFHVAASVRFDDPLKKSVLLNTRGTREALDLAKNMKKLLVFQYVSTTYTYTKENTIQEKLYPTEYDWRSIINLAERVNDERVFEAISKKLFEYHPNSYTFSKALAEQVVHHYRNEVPVVIFRPAVVISTVKEPFVGWVDNMNGPFAIWGGAAKGALRFLLCDPDIVLAYTPVDWAIRGMILVAWARATGIRISDTEEIEVVNLEGTKYERETFRQSRDEGLLTNLDIYTNGFRYPRIALTKCHYYYWLGVIISMVHYSLIIDCFLRLAGQKPRLMAVTRKVFTANAAIAQFMLNEYYIETNNIDKIDERMMKSDRQDFSTVDLANEPRDDYIRLVMLGIFKYVFKESFTPEKTLKHQKRLWILEKVHYAIWILGLMWILSKVFL